MFIPIRLRGYTRGVCQEGQIPHKLGGWIRIGAYIMHLLTYEPLNSSK